MPYGLTFQHKHVPEMTLYTGLASAPLFVPTVGDFAQGMTTFVPLQLGQLDKVPSGRQLHAAIADHYAGIKDSFVMVAPYQEIAKTPALDPQAHNDTNTMTLHVFANDSRAQAVLVAVYDNLGKGASGAAVQNLNLMLGVSARESLAA
jgi:N-acetyl-gamma-glutamyl-phosphate reductase